MEQHFVRDFFIIQSTIALFIKLNEACGYFHDCASFINPLTESIGYHNNNSVVTECSERWQHKNNGNLKVATKF